MKKYFKKILSFKTKFFKNIFSKKEPNIVKELRKNEQISLIEKLSLDIGKIRAIGLSLIIIGAMFLLYPTNLNLKISATIIVIGIFFIFELKEKQELKKITGRYLTIILIIWILIIFFVTFNIEYHAFFILGILGILIIKELLDAFMSSKLKKS